MGEPDRAWPAYGSDLMVDILRDQGIEYVVLNPGASFRGLHDSLVNSPDGPAMLEVPHEKIAAGMAHGYAKVSGRPLAVVLHDLVGLLHGTLGVYYASVDRVPMLVLGGAGPMDQARRRPWIDWIHTANVQNEAVRDFTKWDDHPYSLEAVPDVLARAHRIAMSEPRGPVYVALDALIQEEEIGEREVAPTPLDAPSPIGADPTGLERLAERLARAERPLIVAGSPARDPACWDHLQELAELLPAGVIDTNIRLNFPNRHPLNVTGGGLADQADAVLLVDVKDLGAHTELYDKSMVGVPPRLAPGAALLDLGFGELGISSWAADQGAVVRPDIQVTADTSVALPMLVDLLRSKLGTELDERRAAWAETLRERHRHVRAGWQDRASEEQDRTPITYPRLALGVWEAIRDYDWVLTAGTANGWALRLWDFDRPYRHPGRSLGTATQIGISLGVALAHRGTGRLVVDLQPDGDLLFDASALWAATRHEIPLLVVMVNNRAYHNDLLHQEELAEHRGRPIANAEQGVVLRDPAPDFAQLAESFGWYARGPISDPAEITPAVAMAAAVVAETGRPALVDIVCGRP